MDRVRRGEIAWANIDALHRIILNEILPTYGFDTLTDDQRAELNRFWHRLDPWPDARSGLARVKERYTTATLSNGNVAPLTKMAKNAGLPWDCILSAGLPGAARSLGVAPADVMMVAAHTRDPEAAAACGMKTAFVARPEEYGEEREETSATEPRIGVTAPDFVALAEELGA